MPCLRSATAKKRRSPPPGRSRRDCRSPRRFAPRSSPLPSRNLRGEGMKVILQSYPGDTSMNKSKFVALAIGLAAAAPALADNDGLYFGGFIGKSESKESACRIPDMACDRKATSFSGNLGFMFTPNWGVEAAYHD